MTDIFTTDKKNYKKQKIKETIYHLAQKWAAIICRPLYFIALNAVTFEEVNVVKRVA